MNNKPILVVDDNALNLKLAKVLLTSEGYCIRTAIDAEDALKVLETFHPELILMDIHLPGIDGLELTRRLKADADKKDIIILALTGDTLKGSEEKAFEAGCDGYVTKPIDPRTLPALISKFLSDRV